jgi:hypothetical protein
MNTHRQTRKPYVTPRIVEQGKVASVTRQVTPTRPPKPGGSNLQTSTFVDEF